MTSKRRPDPHGDRDGLLDELDVGANDDSWIDIVRAAEAPIPMRDLAGYDLVEEVGRGGQGVVYRAVDPATARTVALKRLLAGSFASASMRRRFERELEAVALLSHPAIVGLVGLEHADGVPVLVMEWIDGRPITNWARERDGHLAREIAVVLGEVCDGVHHAHQRGVIHRDLKPGNVLIDTGDRPRILDFGLAKIVAPGDPAAESATASGQFVGTILYAAPEQLRGDGRDVDVRSDVYSLGVILYECLTGRLPYDPGRTLVEAAEAIERAVPAAVGSDVDADLEAIVLKALAKDPDHRYQSTDALGRDLRSWLNGEPVTARAPGALTQLLRTVSRHRIAFTFVATVFLLITAAATIAAVSAARLADARLAAETEAAKARATSAFLEEMLASADPFHTSDPDLTVRQVLDVAAERVDAEPIGQPAVEAAIRTTIGRTYQHLGLFERASAQLTAALDLKRAAYGPGDGEVADSLRLLAALRWETGDAVSAERLLREALAMRQTATREPDPAVLRLLNDLAVLLHGEGDHEGAAPIVEEAVGLHEHLLREGHALTDLDPNGLVAYLCIRGEQERAERLLRDRLDLHQARLGDGASIVADDLRDLAGLMTGFARYDEAEELTRKAMSIHRTLHGDVHVEVAADLYSLAKIRAFGGDDAGAVTLYGQALAMLRQLYVDRHPDMGEVLYAMANALRRVGRFDEAVAALTEAIGVYLAFHDEGHRDIAFCRWRLGQTLLDLARYDAAAAELSAALETWRRILPEGHWRTAYTANDLGAALTAVAHYEQAETLLIDSHRIISDKRGPDHARTALAVERLAELDAGR